MKPLFTILLLNLALTMTASAQNDTAFQLNQIGQIAVHVDDLDRATAFYRDQLGMTFLFNVPDQMAFFQVGEVRLLLGRPEGDQKKADNTLIYFKVPDIAAAHAAMTGRGVVFGQAPHVVAKMPDHTLWMASFEDSEGNVLLVMSEAPL